MVLFYVTSPIRLVPRRTASAHKRTLRYLPELSGPPDTNELGAIHLKPPSNDVASADALYLAYSDGFLADIALLARDAGIRGLARVVGPMQQRRVLSSPGLPPRLGPPEEGATDAQSLAMAHRSPGACCRVAIVSRHTAAFGDGIMLLVAMRALRQLFAAHFVDLTIHIIHHPMNLEVERLYLASKIVDASIHLPVSIEALSQYDAWVDLSEERDGSEPRVDEFLRRLGLDPSSVADGSKRNSLIRHCLWPAISRARSPRSRPMVLFHPKASNAFRSMPDEPADQVLRQLADRGIWDVVTAIRPSEPIPNVMDFSDRVTTFSELVSLIADVDAFITVDTCVYHVADAFDVPGVVLFNSQLPDARVRYYPTVKGHLVGGVSNPLVGTHSASGSQAADLAKALWSSLVIDPILDDVECLVRSWEDRAAPFPQPGQRASIPGSGKAV